MEILCFYAGVAFYYFKSLYPLFFIWIVFFFRPKISYFVWFTAAFLLAISHQHLLTSSEFSASSLIKDAKITGYLASLPQKTTQKVQFQFLANTLNGKKISSTMMLTCYISCPEVHAGEHLQLTATIKKPDNLENIGGFDYRAWLGSRHIEWMGNVRQHSFRQLPTVQHYPLLKLRERLAESLAKLIPNENELGVFQALTIGVTQHISKDQWELFRRTGTTHLIDISGEHVALVAGFVYLTVKWLWTRWSRLCVLYPAQKIASIIAMLLTLLYALIAGFSVPTQRAVLMGCFFLLRNVVSIRYSTWQAWRYSLLTVLLFEPHSVLMMGFYFSFLAVAILILIHQKYQNGKIKKLVLMQFACLFGLMPLSLFWFSFASLSGLITNFVAIPWVGFVIVPLALCITVLCTWWVVPGSVEFLQWNLSSLLRAPQPLRGKHLQRTFLS